MIVRQTRPDESVRVDQLFAIAFEQPLENGPAEEESPRVHHWAAFTDDEQNMMSTFTITDFTQQLDGTACKMGGIGGVATVPTFRRQGGIRGCFEASLPWMYEQGYELSYLYPFSTAYYRKFGYENCVQKLACTVNLGLLRPNPVEGRFLLAEPGRTLEAEIRQVDQVLEGRYNMMVLHGGEDYQWIRETEPAKTLDFTYVYVDRENVPHGYTTFRMEMQPDGRNLPCRRFAFTDKEGFDGLMNLFKSLAADHALVKFSVPADTALQYLLPEWSMGAAQWSVAPAGMVRVVNVEQVLRHASCRGSGCVTLAIHDAQIAQNNGTFCLCFGADKVLDVTRTEAQPDAELEISAFSALLSGVCEVRDAMQWMPGVTVRQNEEELSRLFYRKPLMICDYF